MKNAKWWLAATFLIGVLLGALLVNGLTTTATAEPPPRVARGWHYHDGHWNYWDEGDKRWYYTDGSNWYYNDGDAWQVYRFDKGYGREGFERGDYKAPEEGVKIVLPRHGVIRIR